MNDYLERRILEILEDFREWNYYDILDRIKKDIKAKSKKLRSVKSAVLHIRINYPLTIRTKNGIEYFQLDKESYEKQKELREKARQIEEMAKFDKEASDLLRDKYLLEAGNLAFINSYHLQTSENNDEISDNKYS